MNTIVEPSDSFDFSQLSLGNPNGLQGGSYFTRLYNNKDTFYIQTPKCFTKQGVILSGKKMYVDFKFNQDDSEFIEWLENLEAHVQDLIYLKKDSWFQGDIEKDDIESAFTSLVRTFKSGKFYLLRCNVPYNHLSSTPNVKIYNESETPGTVNDITDSTQLISILEITGIKFTTKNFQFDINVKQVMILNTETLFNDCLIKQKKTEPVVSQEPITNDVDEELSNPQTVSVLEDIVNDVDAESNADVDHVAVDGVKQDYETQDHETGDHANIEIDVNASSNTNDSVKLNLNTYEDNNNDHDENTDNKSDEDLNKVVQEESEPLEKSKMSELVEVDISEDLDDTDEISLKKPDEVYYELYLAARKKAKMARKAAIEAHMEVKKIKNTYMLEELEDSEEEDYDSFLESKD